MDIKRYLTVLVCLLLVGCSPPTIYQLAVSPADDGAMRRELTVTNGGVDEMLRTIYGEAVTEDGELRYSGSFDAVPQDVGGSGTWLRVASPMGSVYLYAERFRGDDDLVAQIENRLLATDRMADLLIAWFESELSDDPHWPVLREFMDTQLRHDMKNLSLYVLEMKQPDLETEQWGPVYFARVGQYLVDRGYFGDGDLRALMSLFGTGNPESAGESSDGLMQRMAARRMGLEEGVEVPESLGFLRMTDGLEPSWQAFMSSPVCAELVGAWDVQEVDESLEADDIESAVSVVFFAGIGMEFELFSSPDEVRLTLDSGSKPVATNGEWDDEAQRVTWDGHVRERFGLPLFFYACWAEPDTEYQETHLGGVILRDEPLVKMVAWYTGLSSESQERWDGFIGSLDPLKPIREQVEAARDAGGEEGTDPFEWGYMHLLSALPAEPQ